VTERPLALDPAALDPAFALARRQVDDSTAPFTILAVATSAGLVRAEAWPGPRAPHVELDAVCLLASITKPIVALGVMQLVAEGRLGLLDEIGRHISEFARPGKPAVTAWHLLSHTSGLPDYDLAEIATGRPDHAALVRRACDAELAFAPGSRFAYCSISFDLLAELIARIAGEPYPAYLRRRILEPLAMTSTTFDPFDGLGERMAPVFSSGVPGALEREVPPDQELAELRHLASMALPGAGLWSSAGDLVRLGRAMLRGGELDDGRVLPPAYVALMTREQTVGGLGDPADPVRAAHHALGWAKPDPRTDPASPAAFGHSGATGTRLWIDPQHDLVVVYLTGAWGFPSARIDGVIQAVYAALR
jgi:CubicO group peptidase (beta-lactamase class C family)